MTTETATLTFDEFAANLRRNLEREKHTAPKDDWRHALYLQRADGKFATVDLRAAYASPDGVVAFYRTLPDVVWDSDAVMCALVIPAFVTIVEPGDAIPDEHVRRADTSRVEIVGLTVAAHGRIESWDIRVIRSLTAPPRLAATWTHMVHDPVTSGGERFEALRRAFA